MYCIYKKEDIFLCSMPCRILVVSISLSLLILSFFYSPVFFFGLLLLSVLTFSLISFYLLPHAICMYCIAVWNGCCMYIWRYEPIHLNIALNRFVMKIDNLSLNINNKSKAMCQSLISSQKWCSLFNFSSFSSSFFFSLSLSYLHWLIETLGVLWSMLFKLKYTVHCTHTSDHIWTYVFDSILSAFNNWHCIHWLTLFSFYCHFTLYTIFFSSSILCSHSYYSLLLASMSNKRCVIQFEACPWSLHDHLKANKQP